MSPSRIIKSFLPFLLVALVSAATGHGALADTNGTNFDSLTLGTVNGQAGWVSGGLPPPASLFDEGVVANTYGYTTFGTKAWRISNAIASSGFGNQTYSKSLANEAGEASAAPSPFSGGTRQPYFEAQLDFASAVPGSEQPGLGVSISPDEGDGARMSWVRLQDTPTGLEVQFQDYQVAVANFVVTTVATGLDRTVPHTLKITMQFIDGPANDIVKVYVDGALVHTGTSWEDYARDAGGAPNPVDSLLFRVAGAAAPATMGQGFLIDNFTAYSGPVPTDAPAGGPRHAQLTVVSTVVNDDWGTKTVADFPLFVNDMPVVSGTTYALRAPADAYVVTARPDPNYVTTFSGACDIQGRVSLNPSDFKVCLVTNDDVHIAGPMATPATTAPAVPATSTPVETVVAPPATVTPAPTAPCASGDLIKLADDHDAGTQADSTVYFCGADGRRYDFPNPGTYLSWYDGYAAVKVVTSEVLTSIPLGGSVTYRPGSRLLKVAGDAKVYEVAKGGVLRWLPSEATARSRHGENWAAMVSDLPVSVFKASYTIGDPLPETAPTASACATASTFAETLTVGSSGPQVFALQSLLQCLGFFPADVTPNGKFGPTTEAAVRKFQAAHGLAAPGSVGPDTRAALNGYAAR